MELFILLLLILLNGLFAMSEIALVTARRARLSALAANGDTAAQAAIKLGEDPTRFLSTVQIGITSIGLLSGIVGEAALAGPLSDWLQRQGIAASTANVTATVTVVVVITYLSIVVGELVPKRLGQLNPETVARLVSRPMAFLSLVSRPFVSLLACSTRGILRLFGIDPDKQQAVTEEEIQAMIEEGSESGAIEHQQHEMLRNIFRLDDRHVASIMIPRSEFEYLDIQLSPEENMRRLRESTFSRFPVCDGGPDNLLGVIHTRQAFILFSEDRFAELPLHVTKPVFIPETLSGLEVLEQFRANRMHLAFVIDEYGNMEGLLTLHDVLDVLTGQMSVPGEDVWAIRRENGSWLLDGTIPVLEMKDKLGLKGVPDEDKGHYSILSGMIMYMLGRIPHESEAVEWEGWRFEVVDMDGNRIDKILAEPIVSSASLPDTQ